MKKFRIYDIEIERDNNEIDYLINGRGELGSEVYKAIEDAEEEIAKHDEIVVEAEDEEDINDEFIKEHLSNTLDIYMECHEVCGFQVEEVEDEEDE